jgi:hypothetical protein
MQAYDPALLWHPAQGQTVYLLWRERCLANISHCLIFAKFGFEVRAFSQKQPRTY